MKTTADLYERAAAQAPDRAALIFGGKRRSYQEYLARVQQLGSAIERTGIARQGRVGIFATNSIEHFEAAGAAEYGAYIAALFNFRLAAAELAELAKQAEPTVLFFDGALAETVREATRGNDTIRRFVYFGTDGPDWATPFDSFLQEGFPEGPTMRPEPEDVGTLFYTGGTTGKPRGVPWRHNTLLLGAHRMSPMIEDIVLLQISPLFHTGGRCPVLTAMWNGGTTVLESGFDATRWLDLVSSERINWTFMVPAMMQAVLDHPGLASHDISSLEYVMAASTAIPPALLSRAIAAMGPIFYVAYGSTEGGYISRLRRSETRADGSAQMTGRLSSVGQVLPWADVVLLDDDNRLVANGEVGEVCVRNSVFRDYWRDPEATAQARWGAGYVRTGDLGRFDQERYLWLVDRKKDMIISGGENIFCREVENVLDQHPAVQAVSVLGFPDEKWGESVLAVIIANPGEQLDADHVIAFCRTRLARFKCPKRVEFVTRFPLTSAGKVDKIALRRSFTKTNQEAR